MKWITRERPKIDRIACPWLLKNFVDRQAEFIYVPKDQVFSNHNLKWINSNQTIGVTKLVYRIAI